MWAAPSVMGLFATSVTMDSLWGLRKLALPALITVLSVELKETVRLAQLASRKFSIMESMSARHQTPQKEMSFSGFFCGLA